MLSVHHVLKIILGNPRYLWNIEDATSVPEMLDFCDFHGTFQLIDVTWEHAIKFLTLTNHVDYKDALSLTRYCHDASFFVCHMDDESAMELYLRFPVTKQMLFENNFS